MTDGSLSIPECPGAREYGHTMMLRIRTAILFITADSMWRNHNRFLHIHVLLCSTNLHESEVTMKAAVIIGIVAFMLADTFLMWCLLRANALYERNENRHRVSADSSGERKETPNEET